MTRVWRIIGALVLLTLPALGQGKRLWVLRAPGEMVEYDPATFAAKQTVKVPAEVLQAPQNLAANHLGQMLFAAPFSLPLPENEEDVVHKLWLWDGHAATSFNQNVSYETAEEGSNTAISETGPEPHLSADGKHLFWFANEAKRLQRDEMDLSTATTWKAWMTDLAGANPEELVTSKLPECRCTTGACDETCSYGTVWAPPDGVGNFFLLMQSIAGRTQITYKDSVRYEEQAGKWAANSQTPPLRRVLDAASSGNVIVEAIPDTGCCGWVNQSNDQTIARNNGKNVTVFDELASYKNSDYDVSFFTSNARLSPSLDSVAMTIASTAQLNKAIQLAEQGQANPEESQRIRKGLAELPAVEVKTLDDSPKRTFIPHATLIGWLGEKEILIVEDHVLVVINISSGARRKSTIRVDEAAKVFLR